jgi:DNA polymerase sigma
MAQLNEELLQLVQRLQPSPEERSQQASAFDSVRQVLQVCADAVMRLDVCE